MSKRFCVTTPFSKTLLTSYSSALLIAASLLSHHTPLQAQVLRIEKSAQTKKEISPSDLFFQAYIKLRNGEKLVARQQYVAAWKDYKTALKYYTNLRQTHPLWKTDVVDNRIKHLQKQMTALKPLAKAEVAKANKKVENMMAANESIDFEHLQISVSGEMKSIIQNVQRVKKDMEANKKQYQRELTSNDALLQMSKSKLEIYLKKNQKDPAKVRTLKQEIARVEAIIEESKKYRSGQEKQLQANLKNLQKQLKKHSSTPLKEDLVQRDAEIKRTRHQLKIVSKALLSQRAKADQIAKQLSTKENELKAANTRIADLTGKLKEQSKNATQIVKTLYNQLEEEKKKRKNVEKELSSAKNLIAELTEELDKQKELSAELTAELKEVREDHDRLQSILLKDPDKRISQVVKQNLALIKDLKEARESLKRVIKDQGDDKDRLLIAERDLAVAKQRILDQQTRAKADAQSIKQLQTQLADIDAELQQKGGNSKLSNVERRELLELRRASQRLLNKHKFVQKKYDLIKRQVIKTTKDQDLIKLVKNDITPDFLTDADKKIIEKSEDAITTFNPTLPENQRAATVVRMQREVDAARSLSRKFIQKGLNELAREILLQANEELPNHFPTLMDLGCVNLRMRELGAAEENFKDGIVMQKFNPYAHYMLGLCYYNKQEDELAIKSLKHSLSLNPTNAKAHYFLGVLSGIQGKLETAETHFKDALRFDPKMSHTYFAISVNYLMQNKLPEAQEYYQQALKNGYTPNPMHEKKIGL